MRVKGACIVSLAVVGVLVPRAGAQASPRLEVERGAGAEECPDAATLEAQVERIGDRRARETETTYRVSFQRDDNTFSATIRTEPDGSSERILRAREPTCAALAQATAVTLALLLDADVLAAEQPLPSPPPAAALPNTPPVSQKDGMSHQPDSRAPDRNAMLALGGAGVIGVLDPVAPALTAQVGLQLSRWRLSVGALWIPPQSIALPPGSLREGLLSADARVCVALWRGTAALRLELCSGALLGQLSVQARGYSRNDHRSESWFALPLELTLAQLTTPLGWELSASALVPLRRHDFSVDGVGIAYRSPPVGAVLSLRALGLWGW
jgi:hypothetical protein